MTEDALFHLLTKEYTLVLAQTTNDFEYVKKLRQKVYSSKFSLSPEYLESKGYIFSEEDKQSFIYLIHHKPTNIYIGTIRIFYINPKTSIQKLPMQHDAHIHNLIYNVNIIPVCEISRLALSDHLPIHNQLSQLRLSSYLSMLLMVGTRVSTFIYHYGTMYSIMEPALDKLLKRQGVKFKQVGEAVNYYGMRTPYANDTKEMMIATEKSMGKLTRYYLKELCKNSKKFWQFIDNNPYLERSEIHLDRICKLFEEYGDNIPLELLMGDI